MNKLRLRYQRGAQRLKQLESMQHEDASFVATYWAIVFLILLIIQMVKK